MTTNDVGDIATLTLTVSPFDPTTTATVSVVSPTNVTTTPTATPNGDRSVWTAQLPLTAPGEWVVCWTVTGVGAGVEQSTVLARPTLPVVIAGQRLYATTADLAHWLGTAPPADSRRKLARASRDVGRATRLAVYAVDDNDLPTDTKLIAAFKEAVCAQVEWQVDNTPDEGMDGYSEVKIGSVVLKRDATAIAIAAAVQAGELAPDAHAILEAAGLLSGVVSGYQSWEGAWR